jgi:septal ring factor EnvC (AmiA/AmiB activator)
MTLLCQTANQVHTDCTTANRQLENVSKSAGSKSQRQIQLDKTLKELEQEKEMLLEYLAEIFDG